MGQVDCARDNAFKRVQAVLDEPRAGGTGNPFYSQRCPDVALIAVWVNELRLQPWIVKHRPSIRFGGLTLIGALGQFGTVAVVAL